MRIYPVLFVLLAVGCGSTGVVHVGSREYAAKPSDCELETFSSREDVGRPFEPICLISSESGSTLFNDRSTSGRMGEVQRKACACGADAIVIRNMGRTATRVGRGYSQAMVSVEAIVFEDEEAP